MPGIKPTIIALLILITGTLKSQVPDFCLTRDEYRLYTLINDFREKQGLPVVPVSRALCYVAKIHARDLYHNNPDTSFCSLNSWSDKGEWTACCHSRFTPNPSCIVNKPKELAGYAGEGHELVYWDSQGNHPDTAMRFWTSIAQAREVLLNQNKWSYFNWRAMGVGLYQGYACVWFGEVPDTLSEPTLCANAAGSDFLVLPMKGADMKGVITAPEGRHYLIFGSFNSLEDAQKVAEKYRKDGFYQAKVIVKENTYRVSLSDHATQEEALNARKMLGTEYKEAWITKY